MPNSYNGLRNVENGKHLDQITRIVQPVDWLCQLSECALSNKEDTHITELVLIAHPRRPLICDVLSPNRPNAKSSRCTPLQNSIKERLIQFLPSTSIQQS